MEKVDYMLEQMLPELQDLQEKKLFSPDEIREIVKRRTAFERALIRRVARKEDFLRYAAYELNLDALRKMRLKRRKKGEVQPSISSFSLQRRALNIFERATTKFKGDVGLWIQYSQVAKSQKAKKLIGRVLTDALLHHPTNPTLYILLSNHQLNDLLSPLSARALLQRGLRLLPNCLALWTEYAKMELVFIERLRRRWAVLGVAGQAGEGADEGMESEEGRQVIMAGGIFKLVWEGAKAALEANEAVHRAFIDLVRAFPTPLRATLLEDLLYPSLRASLPDKASTWSLLAQKALIDRPYPLPEGVEEGTPLGPREQVDALKELVTTFKSGLAVLEGRERARGAEEWARLLTEWIDRTEEGPLEKYLAHHFTSLLAPPLTTPTIQADQIAILTAAGSASKALSFARKATVLFPTSALVWGARLRAVLTLDPEREAESVVAAAIKVGLAAYPSEDDEAEEAERGGWESLWSAVADHLDSLESASARDKAVHAILARSLVTPATTPAGSAVSSLPIHNHLLALFLPILHPIANPPPTAARLAAFRRIHTTYLPTSAFYASAFFHEQLLPDPRPVLDFLFSQWQAAASRPSGAETNQAKVAREESEHECFLAYLEFLRSAGDGKAVREVLRSLTKAVGGLGERVEERWRIRLDELEKEEAEDLSSGESGSEDDDSDDEDEDVEMTVQ